MGLRPGDAGRDKNREMGYPVMAKKGKGEKPVPEPDNSPLMDEDQVIQTDDEDEPMPSPNDKPSPINVAPDLAWMVNQIGRAKGKKAGRVDKIVNPLIRDRIEAAYLVFLDKRGQRYEAEAKKFREAMKAREANNES